MFKTILKFVAALVLAFSAYLFYQAGQSESLTPETLDGAAGVVEKPAASDVLTIAFGSCNRQDKPQDYWSVISSFSPTAWLWLGDNVYSDTDDMEKMKTDYETQRTDKNYQAFLAKVGQIYGSWDDHDYGLNDGGKEWPHKAAAKDLLLNFLAVPADAAVRKRSGVYQAYTVQKGEAAVRVILLDTRSFRDALAPPTQQGHRYGVNAEGDILGFEQSQWLIEQLEASKTHDFLVIGSSIQVLPEEHGYEKWANFPKARTALLDAIVDHAGPNVVLLSGDRHLAEISQIEHKGKIIHEVTSSGLTHSYEAADEPNKHRVSPLVGLRNFGLLHFVRSDAGTHLLSEVRNTEDGSLFFRSITGDELMNKDGLTELIFQNKTVTDQLKPCPNKPNCVSTQATQAEKKREPLAYSGSLDDAKEKLKKVISGMARTRLLNEESNYLHYTFKTFPIPFIDDVEFLFDDDAKLIHYRSASRVGHSDLGVNSKRMAKVAKAWNEQ